MSEYQAPFAAKVLVVGSAMTDLTAYTPKIPMVGETIMGSSFQTSFGGKGANQAVQCARLAIPTAFIATVGQDTYGNDYMVQLEKEGIDVSGVKQVQESTTGIAVIWVDAAGMNSIVIVSGANLCMTPEDVLSRLDASFTSVSAHAKIALFQNEISLETNRVALRRCQEHPDLLTIFNPAPYTSSCQSLVHECSILCVNEVELQMMVRDFGVSETLNLSDDDNLCQACLTVYDHTLRQHSNTPHHRLQTILVTLGSLGAVLVDCVTRKLERFIAPRVVAQDSVGAGDSFLGCFAACLAVEKSLSVAVTMAIQCASYSVQQKGAQPSYMRVSEGLANVSSLSV